MKRVLEEKSGSLEDLFRALKVGGMRERRIERADIFIFISVYREERERERERRMDGNKSLSPSWIN